MTRSTIPLLLGLLLSILWVVPAHAAVSCSLNDPDRDVRKQFPSSTGYRTEFHALGTEGGATYRTTFEKLYGRALDTYTEIEVQHAFYPVLKGKTLIGYLYGATQKGHYGTLQVIAVVDTKGAIQTNYFQKISAPYAAQLKDPAFTKQFAGLTLADFKGWQTDPAYTGKLKGITSPTPEAATDVTETLWGLKKVL
ncbi:MAG: hypothetical protein ABI743_11505, partial [bacterium]